MGTVSYASSAGLGRTASSQATLQAATKSFLRAKVLTDAIRAMVAFDTIVVGEIGDGTTGANDKLLCTIECATGGANYYLRMNQPGTGTIDSSSLLIPKASIPASGAGNFVIVYYDWSESQTPKHQLIMYDAQTAGTGGDTFAAIGTKYTDTTTKGPLQVVVGNGKLSTNVGGFGWHSPFVLDSIGVAQNRLTDPSAAPLASDANWLLLYTFDDAPGSTSSANQANGSGGTPAMAQTSAVYASGGSEFPAGAATCLVAPTSATIGSLASNNTVQLTPTAKDNGGVTLGGVTFTWVSGTTAAATVNSSGLVTWVSGTSSSTITVTAVSGTNPTATCAITTRATSVPTTVVVSPSSATIAFGGTATLSATTADQFSVNMPGRTYSWSSDHTICATVNSSGVVTNVAGGTANITATDSPASGVSAITTHDASVATTINVSPSSATLAIGATQTFTGTILDQYSISMGGTIGWASGDTARVTINSSGVASWVSGGGGAITITATSAPASPGTATITPTLQIYDYLSSNSLTATVSATGLARRVAAGTPNITVTRHGTGISAVIPCTLT